MKVSNTICILIILLYFNACQNTPKGVVKDPIKELTWLDENTPVFENGYFVQYDSNSKVKSRFIIKILDSLYLEFDYKTKLGDTIKGLKWEYSIGKCNYPQFYLYLFNSELQQNILLYSNRGVCDCDKNYSFKKDYEKHSRTINEIEGPFVPKPYWTERIYIGNILPEKKLDSIYLFGNNRKKAKFSLTNGQAILQNKHLFIDHRTNGNLLYSLFGKDYKLPFQQYYKKIVGCAFKIDTSISYNRSKYFRSELVFKPLMLDIDSTYFNGQEYNIENLEGKFNIINSSINSHFTFSNCQHITIKKNNIKGSMDFLSMRNGPYGVFTQIHIDSNYFEKTQIGGHIRGGLWSLKNNQSIEFIDVGAWNSEGLDFSFNHNIINRFPFYMEFDENTFDKFLFDHSDTLSKKQSANHGKISIDFKNSNFNRDIFISNFSNENKSWLNVSFSNCTFQPNIVLNITADTIEFINCINIPNGTKLLSDNNRPSNLKFINTDYQNLQFSFGQFSNLVFNENPSDEYVELIYQDLINKFKTENRSESYENVVIEYKQFKYKRKGLWGTIGNTLDKYWWNYGQNKLLIVLWTFGFIFIFCVFNFRYIDKIMNTYPITDSRIFKKTFHENPKSFRVKKIIRVMVFTVQIFFSLKIDFAKLNYSNIPMLLMFFFQYTVGLICIFFVFNAILKFDFF